jgi:2-oxoisovalerate dehydrogenase E2 component (dihydrolipoyl transacylase)
MTMSFGCDHRVINGAEVGNFSNEWKNFLENPDLTMTKMR